jgi:hypothetical protein
MSSKLRYDGLISHFVFNFNLRRYIKVAYDWLTSLKTGRCNNCWQALSYAPFVPHAERQGPLLVSIST